MKTLIKNLWMITALGVFIMLPGCSKSPTDQAEDTTKELRDIADDASDYDANSAEEWEKHKNAILGDLRDLRGKIEKDLGDCNEELAKPNLKASERNEQEAMKAELEHERDVLDETIAGVEGLGADATASERGAMRLKAEKARDEVKTWWEKRKEVQDQHTEADYDRDGH